MVPTYVSAARFYVFSLILFIYRLSQTKYTISIVVCLYFCYNNACDLNLNKKLLSNFLKILKYLEVTEVISSDHLSYEHPQLYQTHCLTFKNIWDYISKIFRDRAASFQIKLVLKSKLNSRVLERKKFRKFKNYMIIIESIE